MTNISKIWQFSHMNETFYQLLASKNPGDLLRESNGFNLPFFNLAKEISAGPWPYHTGSVLDHLADCMNAVAGDPLAVWLAMTHDSGKLTTPLAMLPHHYGHELRGQKIAGLWADILHLPEDFKQGGQACSRLHMRAGRYHLLRPGKKYRFLLELQNQPWLDAFWQVVNADTHSNISQIAKNDWQCIQAYHNDTILNSKALEQEHIKLIKNNAKLWDEKE